MNPPSPTHASTLDLFVATDPVRLPGIQGASYAWPASWWQILICVFVLGLAFSFMVPPGMSPDEHDHVMRAYTVAQGEWMLKPVYPGGNSGGAVDSGLIDYLNVYRGLYPHGRMTAQRHQDGAQARWSGKLIDVPMPGTGFYFPAIYLPQALVLWVGEHAGWHIDTTYRLMRALTLAISAAGIALAFVIARPNTLAVLLLLLPMSIFQMVSPTIDGLALMLTTLALATFVRLWRGGRAARRTYWIVFHLCMLVLVNSRAQALPLLALPFVLFIQHRRKRDLVGGVVQTLVALAWIALVARYNVDTRITTSDGLRGAILHYGSHPTELFTVLWRTVSNPDRMHFYGGSFIGLLGWLDVPLPRYFYLSSVVALGAAVLACLGRPAGRRDILAAGVMGALALASVLIVFFSMLANWTPQPAVDIDGVQGRYFMQAALIFAWAMSLAFTRPPVWAQRLGALILAAYFIAAIMVSSQALLDRYWLGAPGLH